MPITSFVYPGMDDDSLQKTKPKSPNKEFKFVMPVNKREPTVQEVNRRKDMEAALLNPWVASALRGATFGLSDRGVAAGQALFGDEPFDKGYSKHLERQFSQRDAFNEEHPYAAPAMEIAGSVLTAGPVAGLAKGGLRALAPRVAGFAAGKGVAPAVARGAGAIAGGAGFGGVAGASQANEGEVGRGALSGALMGGAATGALKAAGQGVKLAAPAVSNIGARIGTTLGISNPDKWAQREWLKSLGLDGDDLDGLLAKMRQNEAAGPRGTRAMDVAGINAKSKIKGAAIPPTSAKAELDLLLKDRGLDQPERLKELVQKGISEHSDVGNLASAIHDSAKQVADPLYKQLSEMGPINDKRVTDWFNATNDRQSMLKEYVKAMGDRGKPVDKVWAMDDKGFLTKNAAPTFDNLKEISEHLGKIRSDLWDDALNKPSKNTVNINGNKYHYDDVSEQFKSLRDLLDDLTKQGNGESLYARARAISGDAFEARKALLAGREVKKLNENDFKRAWDNLGSDAERDAFRAGVASSLKDTITTGGRGSTAVNNVYGKGMDKKLELVFPDKKSRDFFVTGAKAEGKLAESQRQLAPQVSASGSGLMEQGSDISALAAPINLLSGRGGGAMSMLNRFVSRDWEQHMPKYADPLLRLGMQGPDEVAALSKRIAAQQPGALSRKANAVAESIYSGAPYATSAISGARAEYPELEAFLNSDED